MLPCQTVVRPARIGATPALFRDTPWPSRESLYLHRGHSSCRFATVSPGGLTVEIRFMPEEKRWCPGISRCCFAAQCVLVSPGGFKIHDTTGATSRWTPIQHDLSRFNAVLAGVATVWTHRDWNPRQCERGLCNSYGSFAYTVNSAYNGSAYKELSVIRNWFLFPYLYPSLFYVKTYGYSGSGYMELSLWTNSFSGPNAYKWMQIRLLCGNPLLVKFAPRRLITR